MAPGRGLLWTAWRGRLDRRRFAALRTLLDLYRYAIAHGGARTPVPDDFLRGIDERSASLGLRQLKRARQVEFTEGGWQLTQTGVERAQQALHNLRLWEMYRLHADELALPTLQEDRQLDIRELLPAAAIAALESRLEGRQ